MKFDEVFLRHFTSPGSRLSAISILFKRSHVNIPKLNKLFLNFDRTFKQLVYKASKKY
jgi:hypothetical protein